VEIPRWVGGVVALAAGVAAVATHRLARRQEEKNARLAGLLRFCGSIFLPAIALWGVSILIGLHQAVEQREKVEGKEDRVLRVAHWLHHVVETLLWIAGVYVVLGVLNVALFTDRPGTRGRIFVPSLFRDLIRGAILVVAFLLVVGYVWEKDLSKWIALGAAASFVLGFATQDTLGNLFAGLALLFERSFNEGEWVSVQGQLGQVDRMTWRATRIRTLDNDYVVVPNSSIAQDVIINHSRPTLLSARRIQVGFSYDDPPNRVKRLLAEAACETEGVLDAPKPVCVTKDYSDWQIVYEVKFYIDRFDQVSSIEDRFRTRIWYLARRSGLTIPFPTQMSFETRVRGESAKARETAALGRNRKALAGVSLFGPLAEGELDELARSVRSLDFAGGERVIRQGDAGASLYVVLSGEAAIVLSTQGAADREVARLGAGSFFGEMSLMTGEPRTAHVVAGGDLVLLEVTKESLGPLLARRPELVEEMGRIMAERKVGLEQARGDSQSEAARRAQLEEQTRPLVARIRRFLGV
jgi:small-conductance mechanosensitive channel/CRP-like cAMP-binding protein